MPYRRSYYTCLSQNNVGSAVGNSRKRMRKDLIKRWISLNSLFLYIFCTTKTFFYGSITLQVHVGRVFEQHFQLSCVTNFPLSWEKKLIAWPWPSFYIFDLFAFFNYTVELRPRGISKHFMKENFCKCMQVFNSLTTKVTLSTLFANELAVLFEFIVRIVYQFNNVDRPPRVTNIKSI